MSGPIAGGLAEGLAAPGAEPLFPPRLRGEKAAGQRPMARAVAQAAIGTDPGLVVWDFDGTRLEAAIVLAPEEQLESAMAAVFAAALGLGDALGALAPPEVALHYDWPAGLRVNGARCGGLEAVASTADAAAEPDWLVVGLDLPFLPAREGEPGSTPGDTSLAEEGCAEIGPVALLESWSRHMLVWLNKLEAGGFGALHEHWRARAWRLGELLEDGPEAGGLFMGLDERGGLLVKHGEATRLRPLSAMLEAGR